MDLFFTNTFCVAPPISSWGDENFDILHRVYDLLDYTLNSSTQRSFHSAPRDGWITALDKIENSILELKDEMEEYFSAVLSSR